MLKAKTDQCINIYFFLRKEGEESPVIDNYNIDKTASTKIFKKASLGLDILRTKSMHMRISWKQFEQSSFKSKMHSVPDISRVLWNNQCHCHVLFR